MPQPDSGDNCCDCPSRTGPCDDCGGAGACCIFGLCSILSSDDCASAFGQYFGDGTDCDPDPCTELGCCLYGGGQFCDTTTHSFCDTIPGSTWGGGDFFCWPEHFQPIGQSNCCFAGQHPCTSNDGLGFFCCLPDEVCCNEECCSEGQTCNGIFCE